MFPSQTNTLPGTGTRPYNSGEDLTGMEGRLVKIVDGGSTADAKLPEAVTDISLFILVDGGANGADSQVVPLTPGEERRVRANGAGSAGAVLILEAIAGANIGKVRTIVGAAAGAYFSPGSAVEDFADEQFVKVNPLPRMVVVPSVVTAPAAALPADGVFAALNSTAVNPTKGDFDALLAQCEILRDSHAALVTKVTAIHTGLVANTQLAIA
jgi:hypothetical protein